MQEIFQKKFQSALHEWQLDAGEAILLGLNSIVIAGTGTGKTIPFMLPLLLHPQKMLLIISPLKLLQKEQVKRFKNIGINAVAVNGDTWSSALEKSLQCYQYQAIFTSPEMCLKHPRFRRWLVSEETTKSILATVVDEAHCISQWGGDFRPAYASIDKLQAFMPIDIPMYLTSATIPPVALSELYEKLNIDQNSAYFVNLGNERHNIVTSVVPIKSSQDYEALYPVLQDPATLATFDKLEKTIVFTNAVKTAQIICREIRNHYGQGSTPFIDYIHAYRTRRAKRQVMKCFGKGNIRLLIATCFFQGADVPDVELVVQFGVPPSLSVLTQRFGRAGRSPSISARGILLAEQSMFNRKKRRTTRHLKPETPHPSSHDVNGTNTGSDDSCSSVTDDEEPSCRVHENADGSDGKDWGKKVEEPLRAYVSTKRCRTAVANMYFDNPPHSSTDIYSDHLGCRHCDNCLELQTGNPHPMVTSLSPPRLAHNCDGPGIDFDPPPAVFSNLEYTQDPKPLNDLTAHTLYPDTLLNSPSLTPAVLIDMETSCIHPDMPPLPNGVKNYTRQPSRPATPENSAREATSVHSTPSRTPTIKNRKRPMTRAIRKDGPATRRDNHLKIARQSLENWRARAYTTQYARSPFMPTAFLPDATLTTLASNARIKTVDDICSVVKPSWVFAKQHGSEVLELLRKVDQNDKEERARRALEKREAKKLKTAEKRAAEAQEKRERAGQRTRARQQHTREHTIQSALTGSSMFNSTPYSTPPPTPFAFQTYPAPGSMSIYQPVHTSNAVFIPSTPTPLSTSNHFHTSIITTPPTTPSNPALGTNHIPYMVYTPISQYHHLNPSNTNFNHTGSK